MPPHCDSIDGPVVKAASRALEAHDVEIVLPFVPGDGEDEVMRAFEQVSRVESLGPEARELAHEWFFENVVRIHRAGEGAPYTGLKPAGRDLGPAIPAADKALASGDVAPLVTLLTAATGDGLREQFEKVNALKGYDPKDLGAGRKYVAAYVTYIHYAERLYAATAHPTHGHFGDEAETGAPAQHED